MGVDVGGRTKGFHAVVIQHGRVLSKTNDCDPEGIATWCLGHNPRAVAVDAPCAWSQSGSSRAAERDLRLFGKKISCFSTPTRAKAKQNVSSFYGWVFNGESLYQQLEKSHRIFTGMDADGTVCVETFPHAVACSLDGKIMPAKHKVRERRRVLANCGIDESALPNIDFVDAALCAVAADCFVRGCYQRFGAPGEGYIVLPDFSTTERLDSSFALPSISL